MWAISENRKKKSRIFWEGTRNKTTVQFRTFLSKEATRFIRKYVDQERRNAEAKDPLFVYKYRKNGQPRRKAEKRMIAANLASIYRDAARKMGIIWGNGEHNPLRPKRMRHLFRTACDTAGIPELYTNAFMGHRNHMGQEYSELSKAKLELEYLRVEPFLTVYGQVEENLEIKQDVARLESRIVDLNRNIEDQKRTIEQQKQLSEQIVQVGEGLKRWQEEKAKLEGKIAGFENFQKLVLEQPDEVILEFIKDVRRQLKEQRS